MNNKYSKIQSHLLYICAYAIIENQCHSLNFAEIWICGDHMQNCVTECGNFSFEEGKMNL